MRQAGVEMRGGAPQPYFHLYHDTLGFRGQPHRIHDLSPGLTRSDLPLSPTIATALFEHPKPYGYLQESLIARADRIAHVHELNKEQDRRKRKWDHTPYVNHPRNMATEAIRQGLDPTVVMACLLHDVPEDVKYGKCTSPEGWLAYIGEEFADYPDKDRLLHILRHELKSEMRPQLSGVERTSLTEYYVNTSLGKQAMSYLTSLRKTGESAPPEPSEKDREYIADVLYDLNRMVSASFVERNGRIAFDPSLLTVKILDAWDNLQTTGFWQSQLNSSEKDAATVAKLVRARVLTNIAELFGMHRVAIDMTMALASIQSLDDIHAAQLKKLMEGRVDIQQEYVSRKEEMRADIKHASDIGKELRLQLTFANAALNEPLFPSISVAVKMPWGQIPGTHEERERNGRLLRIWTVPSGKGDRRVSINPPNDTSEYHIDPNPVADTDLQDGVRAKLSTLWGREKRAHKVMKGDKVVGATYLETHTPYMRDLLRHSHYDKYLNVSEEQVPELVNIFHPDICRYTENGSGFDGAPTGLTRDGVDPKHMHLLSFLFDLRHFIRPDTSTQDTPFVIFVGSKMFLATNRTHVSLHDIATREGIQNPVVRSMHAGSSSIPVDVGDYEVLTRLKQDKRLGEYHVAVVGERQAGVIYDNTISS